MKAKCDGIGTTRFTIGNCKSRMAVRNSSHDWIANVNTSRVLSDLVKSSYDFNTQFLSRYSTGKSSFTKPTQSIMMSLQLRPAAPIQNPR